MTLETDRLLLRGWQPEDREPFAALNADPEVMRHLATRPLERAASDRLADRIEAGLTERGFGFWALEHKHEQRFIGFTGLGPMPEGVPGSGGFEVAWRLAREAWGQGLGTEAALAARDAAFDRLGLSELFALTALLNGRSEAVMRHLGMTRVQEFEHPAIPAGHPLRWHVLYRLEVADYRGVGDGTRLPV